MAAAPLPARPAEHCRAPALHPLERLRQERSLRRPLAAEADGGSPATGAILRTRDVESRPAPSSRPQTGSRAGPVGMLCIGASTGGPKAVSAFLSELGNALDHVPTLIVQHMPPIFTSVFADHLRAATGRTAREPLDGERLENGVIYVAPGGRHLRIARRGGQATAQLDDGPPVNFCRPAVDHLFADAARSFGAQTLAIVLTGMGHDGLEGARALKAAGAQVLVQDEASSAVWGMPGSVARAGLADAVLDVAGLAAQSRRAIGEGRR
jgi:two-component system chemotaxis response regulator CheB